MKFSIFCSSLLILFTQAIHATGNQEEEGQETSPLAKPLERQGKFHLPQKKSEQNNLPPRKWSMEMFTSHEGSPTSPEEPNWRRIHEPLLDAVKSGEHAVSALAIQYKTRIIVNKNIEGDFFPLFKAQPEGVKRLVFLIICSTGATSWSFTE